MQSLPYTNLQDVIEMKEVYCLNAHPSHDVKYILKSSNNVFFLKSDSDQQLLINIPFNAIVKIHHIVIDAPLSADNAPKTVKIFSNQLHMDFEEAQSKTPIQQFQLKPDDFGKDLNLKFVKFQSVNNLIIFISDNYGGDFTRVNKIQIHGVALQPTSQGPLEKIKGGED